jgi:hypothetical protein
VAATSAFALTRAIQKPNDAIEFKRLVKFVKRFAVGGKDMSFEQP